MAIVFVATQSGIRTFSDDGEGKTEFDGHSVAALATAAGGTCLAVVDERDIWQRDAGGIWSKKATTGMALQSIVSTGGEIFAGGMNEAAMLRISAAGEVERLASFERVEGRNEWFAGGPPLGVRGLTATADGVALLAAVHVGGIPRSTDRGESWTPTIPIMSDVHEVRVHRSIPGLIAAAAAVGLCVSNDHGRTWRVVSEGLEITNSLAVAVLEDEVLFSIQDGPFAKRSQIWRWKIGGEHLEQVRDGLPEWLEGKVDTNCIAAGHGRTAVLDGGGNLWLSQSGSKGWQPIGRGLPYSFGALIL
jgi:hypothetical protein